MWPSQREVEAGRASWQLSTPSQRCAMSRLDDRNVVLHLRFARAALALEKQRGREEHKGQETGAAGESATAFLSGVSDDDRRKIELQAAFCSSARSFDRLLERSCRLRSELDALHHFCGGPIVVDASGGLRSDGPRDWGALARSYFTLALDAFLRRSSSADARATAQLKWALTLPRTLPWAYALRAWPSRNALATLRATWAYARAYALGRMPWAASLRPREWT